MKTSRIPALTLLLGALLATGAAARDAHADPLHVKDVKLSAAEGAAEVLVVTSGTPLFTARVDGGRRLILDIDGADVVGAPGALTKGNAIVGGVMTQAFNQAGQRLTRVSITLARNA